MRTLVGSFSHAFSRCALPMLLPSTSSLSGLAPAYSLQDRPRPFEIIRRGRRLIFLYLAVSLSLAALYLALTPRTFTSRSQLFVDPASLQRAAGASPRDTAADFAIVDSQAAIIRSDAALRRVVEVLELNQDREFAGTFPASPILGSLLGPSRADGKALATETLSGRTRVTRAWNTYLIDVAVSSVSASKAAQIADTLVSLYLAELANARLDEGRRSETSDAASKARITLAASAPRVADDAPLEADLRAARAQAMDLRDRLDALRSPPSLHGHADALPEALRSATLLRLRERDAAAARAEAALAVQLKPRHPDLIEARLQRNRTRSDLAAELQRAAGALEAELRSAEARVQELEQRAASRRDAQNGLPRPSPEVREQAVSASQSVPRVRVISDATTPATSSSPDPWLVLALGLFGGVGLGGARAYLAAKLDTTVRPPSGVAMLRQQPLFPLPVLRRKVGVQLTSSRRSLLLRSRPGGATLGRALDAVTAPDGAEEARYRQHVLHILGALEPHRHTGYPTVVMAVGTDSRAGQTAFALSLAQASALRGERVLLVDACSAKAALSRVLAPERLEGWAALLARPEALSGAASKPDGFTFALLTLGRANLDTLTRDERRQLAANLSVAALDYDLVIIDGGILAADESASALLPLTDRVLIVARSGKTPAARLDDTLRILAPQRSRIAGIALAGAVSDG